MELSKEEILLIEKESKNKIFSIPYAIFLSNNSYLSIANISQTKKLILIYGNSDTGLKHINERHTHSFGNYKLTKGKITNPNLFNTEKVISSFDYLIIAERIYSVENKTEGNQDENKFDVYEGFFNSEKFRLILYRNSKIIHTIFPLKGTQKPKKIIVKLIIGKIEGLFDPNTGNWTVTVPYLNKDKITKYKFHFRLIVDSNTEELWIELCDNNEQRDIAYLIGKRDSKFEKNGDNFFDHIFHTFRKGNTVKFEQILRKLENKKFQNIELIIEEFKK